MHNRVYNRIVSFCLQVNRLAALAVMVHCLLPASLVPPLTVKEELSKFPQNHSVSYGSWKNPPASKSDCCALSVQVRRHQHLENLEGQEVGLQIDKVSWTLLLFPATLAAQLSRQESR